MLSREDRILSELIVSRGLATPEAVERQARELEDSNETGLVQALVSCGELDPTTGREVHEEAREIDGLLRADLPDDRTLGEYTLVREIGRGGMGIVYEAEQASLGRRVALKVLPAGAALDERLAIRFLREARTAARLRHPGIVPVFGTGREQGVLFFAMELIEGESLAARIDRGRLAPREAAGIAAEIAHALQHAHEAGLVHRDVKPENVMIGSDGRARLTDFGLVHDLSGARLTRSQYVLGTPAYSAPEQARGAPADPRCDVYGAGAVLYAMLCGEPPFSGEVAAAVLGRLINEAPRPLATLAPTTPPALISICERAMARDPAHRFPTAGAMARALDEWLEGGDASVAHAVIERKRSWSWLAGALALVAVVAAALAWRVLDTGGSTPTPTGAEPIRAGLLAGRHTSFEEPPGVKRYLAISPDGTRLVYAMDDANGWGFWLQRLDRSESEAVRLTGAAAGGPAWSPDGTRVSYCSAEGLEIVELATRAVETFPGSCGVMSWSPDATRIVHEDRAWPLARLVILDLSTGTRRVISPPATWRPSWIGGGRIAYIALRDGHNDVWTFREDGSDPRRVTRDKAREFATAWSEVGGLYYASNRDDSQELWNVRLDLATGEPVAPPTPVTRGWIASAFSVTAARERNRVAFVMSNNTTQTWGMELDALSAPSRAPRRLDVDLPYGALFAHSSPTGEDWVVVVPGEDGETLRRYGTAAGTVVRVTDGPYHDGAPRWSPDGSTIAFHSDRSGGSEIWTVRADGTGLSRITRTGGAASHPVWSPDGEKLAFRVDARGLRVLTLAGGDERTWELGPGFEGFVPRCWSADGKRLAGTSAGIVIHDLDAGRPTRVTDFGATPCWTGGSAGLVFADEDDVFYWDGAGEPRSIWSTGPNRISDSLTVSGDGSEVYFATYGSTERFSVLDFETELTE